MVGAFSLKVEITPYTPLRGVQGFGFRGLGEAHESFAASHMPDALKTVQEPLNRAARARARHSSNKGSKTALWAAGPSHPMLSFHMTCCFCTWHTSRQDGQS